MAALLALACAAPTAVGAVDLEKYIRQETFQDIKISPGGDYFAATVPLEDSTAVVIMRTSDNTPMGSFRPPRNNHATSFDWVSNERVLIELSEKFGSLDTPQRTGELYAVNANGGRGELLVGYRVEGNGPGTRIQPKKVEAVAAFLTDELANDDRNVLVAVWPFGNDPFTRVERLDVTTGRRVQV
ncbi:MAG TPA: peptidase S9, partial [Stenotrophomonas sp.]|nr:peptidase S9 [Stenotrophomonas sp.]